MSKYVPYLLLVSFLAILSSCQPDSQGVEINDDQELTSLLLQAAGSQGLNFFRLPEASDLTAIPQDPLNPLTPAKVRLGQLLYHETANGIAPMKDIGKGTYSCASCHFASAGFQADRQQGIGEGGIGMANNGRSRTKSPAYDEKEIDVQPIRTPSAMNGAYQTVMLWNGQFGATGPNMGTQAAWTAGTPKETNFLGFEGLEIQAIAGMKVHRQSIDTAMLRAMGYLPLFDAAYPTVPKSERYTRTQAGLAIAAYERTLLANQAPFQRWLRGETQAMSDIEKAGALLFFGKAKCVDCHTGPALNSMTFHALGMNNLYDCPDPVFNTPASDPAHLGRGGFTGKAEDMHKFKTPQLYNMADSPFLGHGSSFNTIRKVVEYKNLAIPQNSQVPTSQLARQFVPLNLTNEEIDALTAFLSTALRDPNLKRYEPTSLPSGQCFPNNDPMSRTDLGCN